MNCCIKRDTDEIAFEKSLQQKIPRPPNAFMLYANENRKTMAQMYPAESNKEISKRLGNSWKTLEMQEKTKYFDRAKAIDLEHKKKYPNYVYNPKEARLRKALREATRDRSIGASPMLPRPSARRPAHGWVPGHDEQLLMSPLPGMRGDMESPVCFPISSGNGSNQFIQPMNGYGKLEASMPSAASVQHSNYMQPNPLAQLQQQTEMWHNYEAMRPRSSGNPFMMEVPQYPQHHAAMEMNNRLMMEKNQRQSHSASSTSTSAMSLTPPHSNENIPPEEMNGKVMGQQRFEHEVMSEGQPLMENNLQQDSYVYAQNVMAQQYEKIEEKAKKNLNPQGKSKNSSMYLPLSCTNFCASPELFSNDVDYQKEYITKYFQNMSEYEVINVVGEDGISFPYATVVSNPGTNSSLEVSFSQTDVGFVPVNDNSERILDLTNIKK